MKTLVTVYEHQIPDTDWRIDVLKKLKHSLLLLEQEKNDKGWSMLRERKITNTKKAIQELKQSMKE